MDVTGTGNEPDIRVTGSTDFGVTSAWRPAERTVAVCNIGQCDLSVLSATVVGGDHLKLRLMNNGQTLDTIGFGLGKYLTELGPKVSVALKPLTNTFRGRTTNGWQMVDVKNQE